MSPPPLIYTVTGGARVGFVNYTWPLAKLSVTDDRLVITTTMFGLFETGNYSFSKDQVHSIVRYGWIPIIGEGIRVIHTVSDYPQKIVFWCSPQSVLGGIAATGFAPTSHLSADQPPRDRGFPLRWPPLVALIVIWNLLGGGEVLSQIHGSPAPGIFIFAALWLVFGLSLMTAGSRSVQKFLMKPDRAFAEIRPLVLLVATITGFIAILFTIIIASGGFV